MKEIQGQEIKQEINIQDFADSVANIVFSNVKIYINQKFQELSQTLELIEDTKLNVATLSSLLHSKTLFSQEEYQKCFLDIKESFGVVLPGGIMEGEVLISHYNIN